MSLVPLRFAAIGVLAAIACQPSKTVDPSAPALASTSAASPREEAVLAAQPVDGGPVSSDGAADVAMDSAVATSVDIRLAEAALIGCFESTPAVAERWHFSRSATGSLQVQRELLSPYGLANDLKRRAAIVEPVRWHASSQTFQFNAAGEIHALGFVFRLTGTALDADAYSSHAPRTGYHRTGSRLHLERCAVP
jgi:hypothetical protein